MELTPIHILNSDEIVKSFIKYFENIKGLEKANKIQTHVNQCQATSNYFAHTIKNKEYPVGDTILTTLNTKSYFIFSKGETACMGGMIFMHDWMLNRKACGEPYDDLIVKDILIKILNRSRRSQFNVSIFENYYEYLRNICDLSFNHIQNKIKEIDTISNTDQNFLWEILKKVGRTEQAELLKARKSELNTVYYAYLYQIIDEQIFKKLIDNLIESDSSHNIVPDVPIPSLILNTNGQKEKILIPYRKGIKWGFCDLNGDMKIECIFDLVWKFNGEFACAILNKKHGVIDKNGTIILPFIYDSILIFEKGYFKVELDKKFGVSNKFGELLVPLVFDSHIHIDFENGWESADISIDGKYGLKDERNNLIIPYIYDSQIQFESNDLALVSVDGQFGFIDRTGKTIIPLIYDALLKFKEGLAPAKIKNKWGFIDKSGNTVIPFKYASANPFNCNRAAVKDFNDRFGYIDKSGKVAIPIKYEKAFNFDESGLAVVQLNGFYGVINLMGEILVPFEYDGLNINNKYGIIMPCKNKKYGAMDLKGKVIISCQYDTIQLREGGFNVYLKTKGWGVIDYKGNQIIPPIYSEIKYNDGKSIIFQRHDEVGIKDFNGETIVPLGLYDEIWNFKENLASVSKDFKCGFIDRFGNLVIPLIYDCTSSFENGFAHVDINHNMGFIDKNNKQYWED
ncbi:hypothetical protein GCM10027566_06380 [Arachidicoccus ginsenosidivorans]|uniref:WG repeat-containing protein n=1 Tax=Arachidicoccus ginsenosidivorans TaxID=496057 RepID=A0A5B8VRD1_9BACT|nr:WG repeat-containing protein [Arachidicoccus ginsenosidivorans]QEC73989.1 WG repeat-containing protein [Arachidicoccus ginsenosidivorans]